MCLTRLLIFLTLGGKVSFVNMVKGPHENLDDLKKYLEKQLELVGVKVVLSKEVDAAFVASEAPDAVILAVGGQSEDTGVRGTDRVPTVHFDSFMNAELGDKAVVHGSNAQAFDCALWCTARKKHVTIVTPRTNKELDMQQSQHAEAP